MRLDDQTARMVELRQAGRDSALLWYAALCECAAVDKGAGGDGYMPALLTGDTLHLYGLPKKAVRPLVDAGLWHDHDTVKKCVECCDNEHSKVHRVGPGDFFIHRWWELLLESDGKSDPIKRKREQRRKALNNDRQLVARIRERDKDLCRYCGVLTLDSSGPNKKGANVRQLDHVDPWGDNTYENVVVSCRTCNGRKRDRTPDEAGMVLLPPGIRPDPAGSGREPATGRNRPGVEPAADPAVPRVARETGPGRIGNGPDRAGAGSGPGPGPFDDPQPLDGRNDAA